MNFKSRYIITLMFIFLVFVFLDQNRIPVPVKVLFGNPFHLELTLVIIVSMVVSSVMTIGAIYLMNRRKDNKKTNASKPSPMGR
jgi:uncharacterized integral membrane protein